MSDLRRRSFMAAAVALAAAPFARAQAQSKVPLVGVMLAAPVAGPFSTAFRHGLKDLGYVEGKNIRLEFRTSEGRPERLPQIAAEIVRLKPDVIVAGGGGPSAQAALKATTTIPIVVPATADPVGEGLVQTLARPGGNVTGLSILSSAINAKRMQVLKELLPNMRRVGMLSDPKMGSVNEDAAVIATQHAARGYGVHAQVFKAGAPEEFDDVFRAAKKAGIDGLIVTASSTYNVHRKRLVDLAAEHRLIAIWEGRPFVISGGLLSYGPDIGDLYRIAARYVHQILKGAKPADLPVEQASKFELVINLKTARAHGVTVPRALLARADQIIE